MLLCQPYYEYNICRLYDLLKSQGAHDCISVDAGDTALHDSDRTDELYNNGECICNLDKNEH